MFCVETMLLLIFFLYGYEFITFKLKINLYYILGIMKKSSKRTTITTGSTI